MHPYLLPRSAKCAPDDVRLMPVEKMDQALVWVLEFAPRRRVAPGKPDAFVFLLEGSAEPLDYRLCGTQQKVPKTAAHSVAHNERHQVRPANPTCIHPSLSPLQPRNGSAVRK